jgi:hypothetical protein
MSVITVQELKFDFDGKEVIFFFAKKMNGLFVTSHNEIFQNILHTTRFTIISKTRIRDLETDTEMSLNFNQGKFIDSIVKAIDSFYERIASA